MPAIAGLILLFLALPASAIDQGPVFRTISVNEGLPDRQVEAIVQDARGFVWIGTRGGLVRHEGGRMRIIPSDPETPNPLPGRNIMSLMAHSDGSVWAAVENRGVVQIAPDLTSIRHLEPTSHGGRLPAGNIWSMAEDCHGRVWMAFMRGGVALYDPAQDTLELFPQTAESGLDPGGFQVHLDVDSHCRPWLVQTGQVSVFDEDADRFTPVRRVEEAHFAISLAEANGRIYFNEAGALMDLGPSRAAPTAEPRQVAQVDGTITGIAPDPQSDQIIVATTSGLHRYRPGQAGWSSVIRHVPGLNNGLPSNAVDGLLFDREGGLWLTTTRSGAAYLPPGFAAFERYQPVPGGSEEGRLTVDPVTSLDWDSHAGGFWVGGRRGQLEFLPGRDGAGTTPVLSKGAREALAGANVLAVMREGDVLYVTTQTAVVRVELGSEGRHEVLVHRQELDSGTFAFLRRKDADQLWLATRDAGLLLIDERTGARERFHSGGDGRNHLPEASGRDLLRGPAGRWWLLAPGGLYRWDEESGFTKQAIDATEPLASAAWLDDQLWLATDEALHLWRRQNGGLTRVEEIELAGRLPPGRMIKVLPDADGDLWLMRTSGLSRFRPADGSLRHFSQRDGLAPVAFGENTAQALPDGRLAFAGQGGIVAVDPAAVRGVSVAPRAHLSRLQAGDRTFELGPGKPPAIELDHDDNSLFIDFVATTYLAHDRTRYRIKLAGWDDDWIDLIGQTRHHYSSLPPGKYRFRVRAAAPDGPWSEAGDDLAITIRQPPWLSGWALGAYVLLAATGAGVGLRSYRRANKRRREMNEARHKRALADEQRLIITRLNRSLEPIPLAETIATEIVHVTGARRAWLGYLEGHFPRELVCSHPDAAPLAREQWRRRLERANGSDDLAVDLQVGDRVVARVLVEGPVPDVSDAPRERLRLLEEMAGQALHNALLLQRVRSLAERAEQASNAKSEFLATMSHEIRTPLHGVLGMVELLYETETEPGQQDILDTLRQSGLQLQRIIDDVLDISRIEAGRMSLNAQPFDLTAMLEQVVDLHAPNAARQGLDLRLRLSAELPLSATGDSDRISQVLGNLLSNAVKFTDNGGIELSAETGRDGYLVVVVSDSGPGIGERDRKRLFEPFTQLDASITRSYSGSGLGLAICRKLVDAMGGTLDLIESCHGGSRFRVRLPVLGHGDEPVTGGLSRLLEGQVVCARVSSATLRVLRRLARRWGIRVLDAREAPRPCDLLLIDPQTLDETDAERLDQWRRSAQALAWLQSPFPSHSGPPPLLPRGAHFLRWPLVESRFIGLLFDLRIGSDDGKGSNE
ncbi:MAG: ATP-binding protein [Xanthomonadales bacterium]|nr:ATP-binding protein [Xanthomonadales bacterium]